MYKIKIGTVENVTTDSFFTISSSLLDSIRSYLSSSKSNRSAARVLLLTLLATLKTKSGNPADLYLVHTPKPVQLVDSSNNSILSANVSILGMSPGSKTVTQVKTPGAYETELKFLMGHPIGIKYNSNGNVITYGIPGSTDINDPDVITQFDIGIRDLGFQYNDNTNKIVSIQSYTYKNEAGYLPKVGSWNISLGDGPVDHNFFTYDNYGQPADWVFDIKEINVYNDAAAKQVIDESIPNIIEEAVIGSLASTEKFYVAR